jgi:subtilisin family serine protease
MRTVIPVFLLGCTQPSVDPVPGGDAALPGDPDSSAHAAIPDLPYVADGSNYSEWPDPGIGSALWSHDTFILLLAADASVGEANALFTALDAEIVGGSPPVEDGGLGFLALRLPTTDHEELEEALAIAREDGAVAVVVQDVLMQTEEAPKPGLAEGVNTKSKRDDWRWETDASGGNWGHELARLPQAWNLNSTIRASGRRTTVVVIDNAFQEDHADLFFDDVLHTRDASEKLTHGTLVAGMIAATHGDHVGVDGVSPFVHLVGIGYEPVDWSDKLSGMESWYHALIRDLDVARVFNPSVVNRSLGYALNLDLDEDGDYPKDPGTIRAVLDPRFGSLVSHHGDLLDKRLSELAGVGFAPLFVSSAGNEHGRLAAAHNSPECQVALAKSRVGVLCVEAIDPLYPAPVIPAFASYSNGGGIEQADGTIDWSGSASLSAPAGGMLSPTYGDTWKRWWGTSAATPFVSGLAAWLLALDPSITIREVEEILTHELTIVGAQPTLRADGTVRYSSGYPDLFDALWAWDEIVGGDALARDLVDVDDGTPDGNTRVDAEGTVVESGLDTMGDGVIDMRDFRRYRDWLLQVREQEDVAPFTPLLDGSLQHVKKDVNGDDEVDIFERLFPLGDFNGDGKMTALGEAPIRGRFNADYTDLGVMQQFWDDTEIPKTALPDLLESADVHTYPGDCYTEHGAGRVVSWVEDESGGLYSPARELADGDHHVATVPSGAPLDIVVEALDSAGGTLMSTRIASTPFPGEDLHVAGCADVGSRVILTDDDAVIHPYQVPLNGMSRAEGELHSSMGYRRGGASVAPEGMCATSRAIGTTHREMGAVVQAVASTEYLEGQPTTLYIDSYELGSTDEFGNLFVQVFDANEDGSYGEEIAGIDLRPDAFFNWYYTYWDAAGLEITGGVTPELEFELPEGVGPYVLLEIRTYSSVYAAQVVVDAGVGLGTPCPAQ